MNFKHIKFIIPLVILLGFVGISLAQSNVEIKVKLDSVDIQMGRMTNLHVSLTQPKDVKGNFPLLTRLRDDGIIHVCGDSVEFRAPAKYDTIVNGNNLTINFDVPVQSFDSGYYQLPRLIYVFGKDSVSSNSLGLRVYPVNADANTPINDYASVADPENPSIFDVIPDWIIDLWWLWIIIVLALIVFFYAMKKYKRDGFVLPKKPEPTPYEAAISALRELKEKKLWEQGMEKDYFTELTEILRIYLFRRFGINAMEMTSRQILASLRENKEISDKRDYFRQILNMADFVKFAKVRPLPDDNVKAYENALRFVEETKPVEKPDEENTLNANGKSTQEVNVKKGGDK